MNFGVSSMVLPLKKVALLRPGASLLEADINKWHYSNIFNPDKVQGIYNNFVNLLTDEGVEIFWIEENTNIADAIFTYDASMMRLLIYLKRFSWLIMAKLKVEIF